MLFLTLVADRCSQSRRCSSSAPLLQFLERRILQEAEHISPFMLDTHGSRPDLKVARGCNILPNLQQV